MPDQPRRTHTTAAPHREFCIEAIAPCLLRRRTAARRQDLASHRHSVFDGVVAVVRHEQSRERFQPPPLDCRLPDQTAREMRALLIEVASEKGRHEHGDDGERTPKAGKLGFQSEIGLVVAESMDGEIHALPAHHRPDLRRNALFPRQPFAEHDGLTREQDRRQFRIDGVTKAANTISRGIDRVRDGSSVDRGVACAPRYERPAKPRIGTAQRFFL